jgi:dTMP kinase
MTKLAKWIVIEGLDGAGKTSAIATIQSIFDEENVSYKTFREPGGTALGEAIRSLFKKESQHLLPLSEVLLMYAARLQLLHQEVFPAIESGISVILDRHELSTFAYQAGGRGVAVEQIRQISRVCMPSTKPDLTLYLAVDPKVCLARVACRGDLDAIESQGEDVFARMAAVYADEIQHYPGVVVIDANRSFSEVQDQLRQVVKQYLAEVMHANH